MDFDFTDEQQMLRDTVNRMVAETYDFQQREKLLGTGEGWSRKAWNELAELGLLALPFSEADGGFAGGGIETMIVMEAIGRGLMLEPYLATIIVCGGILRHAATDDQREAVVPGVIAGETVLALAHHERAGPRHGMDVQTTASRSGDRWVLDGRKTGVVHGPGADRLVASARTERGLGLFLVDAQAEGVAMQPATGYDGVPVAAIDLVQVKVGEEAILGEPGKAEETLQRVFEEATAALVAEAVGIMEETLATTVDYLKTRKQFGVPIGSFQALQHRAVDMLMNVELSRSMAILAALSLESQPEERARSISQAKAFIGKAGRLIGQEAVQMHGAIGITSEYKVGHALKRLTAIDAMFGNSDHHIVELARCG